ncbi:hypothetical protein [Chitinimonas taiwanensis]|uniref:Transmembrane protein n=1 Tax=Chitinimonas taiwanensis DSM 18899 TaxID=1121279 RepID=A0A1K2HMF7_9NEIS|nr:hypothetical protein [Chitinimonas taiwanensis]SFZ78008.1 hypothetical protein SAMN02745887_02715 [Chitinimonas taiwanensis DSM 18899]
MTPSVPIPTDNIYKFACLFGLALIVSGIFAFVSTYTASLDRKVKYSQVVLELQAKPTKTKAEERLISLNERLIEVTRKNENSANSTVGFVIGLGLVLSGFGATRWYVVIQRRDDRLAALQLEKLEAEIAKLRSETKPPIAPVGNGASVPPADS